MQLLLRKDLIQADDTTTTTTRIVRHAARQLGHYDKPVELDVDPQGTYVCRTVAWS
jgi:hypothetical protein